MRSLSPLPSFAAHQVLRRECQVKDFKLHKKFRGQKLSSIDVTPTFTGPSTTPKFRSTTGIQRHLGEIRLHEPASWHVFYGNQQKRVLHFPDLDVRKRFVVLRDKAITERDPEAIGAIATMLKQMVHGRVVTQAMVDKQMMGDFAIDERFLRDAEVPEWKLRMMGF